MYFVLFVVFYHLQFFLSRADREALDNGDPKEILEKVSRKLPVFTQTVSGGKKTILLYSTYGWQGSG